jgi:hypothetical protein
MEEVDSVVGMTK